jgi:TPR repeat protein
LGVPLNYAEAYKWFMLAAKSRNAVSAVNSVNERALESLAQIMTTNQLRDGQTRVSEWITHRNSLNITAQTAEPSERDSYVTAAEP